MKKQNTDWKKIRLDAEASGSTIAELARIHGVTEGAIKMRKKREGWNCVTVTRRVTKVEIEAQPLPDLTDEERMELAKINTLLDLGVRAISEVSVTSSGEKVRVIKDDVRGADYKAVVEASIELMKRKRVLLGIDSGTPSAGDKYETKDVKRQKAITGVRSKTPFKPFSLVNVAA